eukprot:GAHX01000652.1.p1 GENE.GAHX01000652.1~~GAHX01000652.1.p1  ORF type:complete len:1594 (+),score=373.75 GAHX01000652.1:54-4835(+)
MFKLDWLCDRDDEDEDGLLDDMDDLGLVKETEKEEVSDIKIFHTTDYNKYKKQTTISEEVANSTKSTITPILKNINIDSSRFILVDLTSVTLYIVNQPNMLQNYENEISKRLYHFIETAIENGRSCLLTVSRELNEKVIDRAITIEDERITITNNIQNIIVFYFNVLFNLKLYSFETYSSEIFRSFCMRVDASHLLIAPFNVKDESTEHPISDFNETLYNNIFSLTLKKTIGCARINEVHRRYNGVYAHVFTLKQNSSNNLEDQEHSCDLAQLSKGVAKEGLCSDFAAQEEDKIVMIKNYNNNIGEIIENVGIDENINSLLTGDIINMLITHYNQITDENDYKKLNILSQQLTKMSNLLDNYYRALKQGRNQIRLNSILLEDTKDDKENVEKPHFGNIDGSILHNEFKMDSSPDYEKMLESIKVVELKPPSRGAAIRKYELKDNPAYINLLVSDIDNKTILDPYTLRRIEISNQKNFAYMEKYSASLQGGKIVLRDIVISAPVTAAKEEIPKGKAAKKGNKKVPKEKKSDIIKKQNEEKLRKKKLEDLKLKIKVLANETNPFKKINNLDNHLASISDPKIALFGQLYLLKWCLKDSSTGEFKPGLMSRTLSVAFDIFRRFKAYLNSAEYVVKLLLTLRTCGFETQAKSMLDILKKQFPELDTVEKTKGKTKVKVKVDIWEKSTPLTVINKTLSPERFQLKYGGPLMVRNVESAADPRVSGFYPDRWQRELLDVFDLGKSVLVVAPTSSGKTFITYYAFNQTLIENKTAAVKNVVVYCAPNKALVNQASGDIYKRYGNVFGELTDEYSTNFLNCEVLITLPSRLEDILINPIFKSFANRISTVIIDEVHCLEDSEIGHLYQKIFTLLKCPFVALSATVGNPENFKKWLEVLKGEEIEMIINNERWSDIEKRFYIPRPLTEERLDVFKDNVQECRFTTTKKLFVLHPAVILSFRNNYEARVAFFKNTVLSAEETYTLYKNMEIIANMPGNTGNKHFINFLEQFNPDLYFKGKVHITKNDLREYSVKLMKDCESWYYNYNNAFNNIIANISKDFLKFEKIYLTEENLIDNFVEMLIDLRHNDMLPVLVFCMDRNLCEVLLRKVVETLASMEEAYNNKEDLARDIKRKHKLEEKARKAIKRKRDKEEENNDEDPVELEEREMASRQDDPNYVDPKFTFVKPGETVAADELDFWMRKAKRKTKWGNNHPMIKAVFRGIGVHHEGLAKGYRHLIETLFRYKHIRVVICTGSLAMGVNMPCKTTVFAGDSETLTPVSYRQMMGRAGRRGFDNIGYVVFYGVPFHKTTALMASKMMEISKKNILTPGAVLKQLSNLENVANKHYFVNDETKKVYYRESIEFLMRLELINKELAVKHFWRFATCLEEHQPGIFVFIKLLKSGYFHRLSEGFNKQKNGLQKSKELLNTLALLFLNVPIPEHNPHIYPKMTKGNLYNQVISEELVNTINEYNSVVKHSYKNSIKCNIEQEKIPMFPMENNSGWPYLRNSYVVDFYGYPSYTTSMKENQFDHGYWMVLKKWSILLSTLKSCLCEYMDKEFYTRSKEDPRKINISEVNEDEFASNLFFLENTYQTIFNNIGEQTSK